MSEIPTFVKKKYQGSSRNFRRKPVRRSLHRPKMTSKMVVEGRPNVQDLTQLANLPKMAISEFRPLANKEKSRVQENENERNSNPFKHAPKTKAKITTENSELMPRSILPSESYAKMVNMATSKNFAGLPVSPRLRNKTAQKVEFSDSKLEQLQRTRSKRPKRFSSTNNSKTRGGSQAKLQQTRAELQEKYQKQNSMSHTPDVRSRVKPTMKKGTRSSTRQPKTKSSVEAPFLRDPPKNRKFTLVLDLDETLIHFKNIPGKSKFLIRPHCYKFLRNLHSHFEVIIFTAAQQQYADWIINKIDQKVSECE